MTKRELIQKLEALSIGDAEVVFEAGHPVDEWPPMRFSIESVSRSRDRVGDPSFILLRG